VAQAIDGSAQVIIAALDQILHDKSAPLRPAGEGTGQEPAVGRREAG
jgi:hypothetical protein